MERLAKERRHLAQADSHIAAGERRIASQMLLIKRLQAAGQGTEAAEALLAHLQGTLETWNAHRDKILQEITRLTQPASSAPGRRAAGRPGRFASQSGCETL